MRDGSNTRRKIQETALRLFVEQGVSETTVRDLAKAAGIAEGTLYRHYASMNDLVQGLFTTHYAAFAHRLDIVQAAHTGFAGKIDAIVAEFCRFFDAETVLFRFLMLVQHQTLPNIANDTNNPVEQLSQVIALAMDRGEISRRPVGLATAMVLGLLLQPAFGLVYGRIAPPFSQYVNDITAACLAALRSSDNA
ncbi:MAG: TetR family transcriptional regulator [Alphaproteobacteria bacterium]|nr:TetR family transcriptional regulator [Alphaproteobacteria bacterium]